MLHLQNLRVEKAGHTICSVPEWIVSSQARVALIGPNGSGKTTLLRVLGGLERNVTGVCRIEAPLRQRVYVHQSPCLFRGSVRRNVAYGLAARSVPKKKQMSIVQHWLKVFGIDELAERNCGKLSGGERRRVALARAFAIQAELLLLDEPFADLDPAGVDMVCRAIAEKTESTIVIVSPVPLPPNLSVCSQGFPFSPAGANG